jgi:3-oxoacyl-[acyl-carrier protein] reductase
MSKLNKKVALVTGGSRGIGAAIAKRLAADGATVAITYAKDAGAASSVVRSIEAGGGKALAIQADAANAEAVNAAVQKTVTTLGGIDVLVNNAGTAIPKAFEQTTLEEFDRVFDINVRGVMVATQAALKHMKAGGRIIMIGSCVGERMMTPGLVPYSANKRGRQAVDSGIVQRGWETRHHGEQYSTGSNRHGLKSGRRRLGRASEGGHSARPLRQRRRSRRTGVFRRRP